MPKRALIIGLFGVLALSGAFFVFWERGQKLGMPTNDQATSLKSEQSSRTQTFRRRTPEIEIAMGRDT